MGREADKGSLNFMTASVVKCDRLNSIFYTPHPKFPISSDMLPFRDITDGEKMEK